MESKNGAAMVENPWTVNSAYKKKLLPLKENLLSNLGDKRTQRKWLAGYIKSMQVGASDET